MSMMDEQDATVKVLFLEETHLAEGARLMSVSGWRVPAHFGNPEAEYRAATEAVALMDAGFFSVVAASGKDHIEYLNRRLSQRVLEMEPGQGLRANQLSAEGRMEADLQLYRATEELSLLIAPPAVSGEYLQFVADKYVFSEDAKFEDETDRWALFAVLGPKAAGMLEERQVASVPEGLQITPMSLQGFAGYRLTSEFLPPGTHLLVVPQEGAEKAYGALLAQVEMRGGSRVGFLPFDTLRIEAGIPWWGIDLTAQSIPLEAGLMSAIHTNKGCYPGQETIAKVLNLGHPARKLVGVIWESEDPPSAGESLLVQEKEAGKLTSSSFSPRIGKGIGLAMVRWQYREEGTEVFGANGLKGRIVGLPFGA